MIRKTGNWNLTKNFRQKTKNAFNEFAKMFVGETSKQTLDIVLGHLDDQDLGHKPLDADYLQAKARRGEDTGTLIATMDYYNSIRVHVKKWQFFAGIEKGARNRQGESLEEIAAIHEFGALSVGIEARPLWQPSLMDLDKWIDEQNFQKKLKQQFANQIKK